MGWIILAIVIVVIIALVLWAVGAYNALVALRNRVKNGWAQIDVQLKQRADLIPNLVETVKGYAGHESSVLTQVTQARAWVTWVSTEDSCPAYPLTVSTRFGIRSARCLSCTSICAQPFFTRLRSATSAL